MANDVSSWVISVLDSPHGKVRLSDFAKAPASMPQYLAASEKRELLVDSGSVVDDELIALWLLKQLDQYLSAPWTGNVMVNAAATNNMELISRIIDLLARSPRMDVLNCFPRQNRPIGIVMRHYVMAHLKTILRKIIVNHVGHVTIFEVFKLMCAKMRITFDELFYSVSEFWPCMEESLIYLMLEEEYYNMIKWFFESQKPGTPLPEDLRKCIFNTVLPMLRRQKTPAAENLAEWLASY